MSEDQRLLNTSCISDRPIGIGADTLGNNRYALGLLQFIRQADTPITIGIQGGWGSGKTSLINLLQYQLEKQGDTLCVFVNAWEHSLFQSNTDKSGVAISILSGVVESLCVVIDNKTKLQEDDPARISDEIKAEALKEDTLSQKAGKVAVGLLAHAARLGAKLMADIDMPGSNPQRTQEPMRLGAQFIRDLRSDLAHAVQVVTEKSPYKRFVCFVDDLDRVHPKTAIEILDVLKNVFDISQCVFILAIDFEVVVKGLEDKYGEKTSENEREFRQYFDKIIQVPFSMPVGGYSDKLEKLLAGHFASLELPVTNLTRITDVAFLSTDGIPRGVKRIVNTLSLLLRIRESSETDGATSEFSSERLEILFIIVALQIHFPEIYRRLAENPYFSKWEVATLEGRWDLLKDADEELFAEDGDRAVFDPAVLSERYGSAFDDEWEHVVYLLCQRSPWLRQKSVSVSRILNLLLDVLSDCDGDVGIEYLQDALDAVNVTDVDAKESLCEGGDEPRNDNVTRFCQEVHKNLAALLSASGITMGPVDPTGNWAKKRGRSKKRFYQYIPLDAKYFDTWSLELDGGLATTITLHPPHGRTRDFRMYVASNLPPQVEADGDYLTINLPDYDVGKDVSAAAAANVAKSIAKFILDMKTVLEAFN
jgi:hypothetical protein